MPLNISTDDNQGINAQSLKDVVNAATKKVNDALAKMEQDTSNVSITDMFDVQLLMNSLAQVSEMSTSVISASNSAIMSMARNIK